MMIGGALKHIYLNFKLSPLDAEILLSLVINRPKEYILAHPEKKITKLQRDKFLSFAKRRFAGEPLAYIVKKKEFFGLEFSVNKNVLIPRPETELLVESVLNEIQKIKYKRSTAIVDLGTGSGNIIISIIKNIPKKIKRINFYAVDISKEALIVAKENAKKHKVEKKIKFIQSDALEYFFKNKIKFKNVFIIANLPYVSRKIYDKNKNNLKYEPKEAILSLENGLAHYKKLFKQVESLSADKCLLFIEINAGQKFQIVRISRKYMPKSNIFFSKDLASKWRIVKIEIM